MLRDTRPAGSRDWIAPGTSLAFAVLMAWLAPNYPEWFGAQLPRFTREFLAIYPLWIAVTALAFALALVGDQVLPRARDSVPRRLLDGALTVAAILIVACGIVALALPLLPVAVPY